MEEARGHTLQAASRLERFETLDDLITRLLSNFKSNERVMILVVAPTSKVRVNHDLLDKAAQIFTRLIPLTAPEDRAVLAVCGQRVSLLSAIANEFDTATLTPQHYTVMLTKGDTQTKKSRPCFVELATQSQTGIPHTRSAHICRPPCLRFESPFRVLNKSCRNTDICC